jgi:hypothetical protein
MPGDKDPKSIDQEKPRRIGDLDALRAEIGVLRENARVVLETDGSSIEGILMKPLDDRFGFVIQMDNGDSAEFGLRGEAMSQLPEGADWETCLPVRVHKADGTTAEYWTKPIRNLDLKR